MTWRDWQIALLALVIWREARGEPHDGKRAVAHVIRNRVLHTEDQNRWEQIICARLQFSSMTAPGDGMLIQWPSEPDAAFDDCMFVALSVYAGTDDDPTGGALHYCNLAVAQPKWAEELKPLVKIGKHTFFV